MRLKIYLQKEQILEFDSPDDSIIFDVKDQIYELRRFEPNKQHLFFAGRELDNRRKLSYYRIITNDPIRLEVDSSTVRVKVEYDGNITEYTIQDDKLIGDFKLILSQSLGIPSYSICLMLREILFDNETLQSCEIYDNTKVKMFLNGVVQQLRVVPPTGNDVMLDIMAEDTFGSIKQKLFKTNRDFPICDKQRLFYENRVLNDAVRVADFRIGIGTIQCRTEEIGSIFISKGNDIEELFGTSNLNKIEDIKHRIELLMLIPTTNQHLSFGKKILFNQKTLAELNIPLNRLLR